MQNRAISPLENGLGAASWLGEFVLGILALVNVRSYIIIAVSISVVLLFFVTFDTAHSLANFVHFLGATSGRVLGPFIVGFITVPIRWALTDSFGAIVAGVLWPLSGFWLMLLMFLAVFSLVAPLFGWTLDWGRLFNFK
jgi:hypothetical protein